MSNQYESRFLYITNITLREHMGDALEFISNIISISDTFPEESRNYFYKTCILYTASIIESHIHHCIIELGHTHYITKEYKYKNIKIIHECGDIQIMSGKREKEQKEILGNIDFNILNELAKKHGIYDEIMFKKIDKIRKLRNQIHLMKLEDIDRKYPKAMLNEVFDTARDLFKIIESILLVTH